MSAPIIEELRADAALFREDVVAWARDGYPTLSEQAQQRVELLEQAADAIKAERARADAAEAKLARVIALARGAGSGEPGDPTNDYIATRLIIDALAEGEA